MDDGPIVISIPVDINRFSANSVNRETWRGPAGAAKTAKGIGYTAWVVAGRPKSGHRLRVDIHIARANRLDEFNILGAAKSILDGICTNERLVPDDNPTWIKAGGVTQDIKKEYKGREYTRLTFTPIGPYDEKEDLLWPKSGPKKQTNS